MSILSRKIGIDLGTSTVRVYVRGEGVVVNEPALAGAGREPALRQWIARAQGRARLFKPEVALAVPSAISSAERRAVTEAAIAAGARQAWLIDEPLAAAIGAGLPIAELRACAICDIGGGTTEIAVISLSGMIVAQSIPVGGNRIDEAIAARLHIDRQTAERVKIAIGSAVAMDEPLVMQLEGVDVTSNDIAEAIQEPLRLIAGAVRAVMQETPAQLASDIRDRGIVLSGGGSQLRNLDVLLREATGLPVMLAEDPLTAVAIGTGRTLDDMSLLREVAHRS